MPSPSVTHVCNYFIIIISINVHVAACQQQIQHFDPNTLKGHKRATMTQSRLINCPLRTLMPYISLPQVPY